MRIQRMFTASNDYENLFERTRSDVAITTADGNNKFEQKGVEHPVAWSENAVTIAASKYFYGNVGDEQRESSVFAMVERVVEQIRSWGAEQGYFDGPASETNFVQELSYICLNQMAAFNSPVWFNFGTPDNRPRQASACFIQSVDDSMEGIMDLATNEALVFKGGSGSGVNMSPLRSSYESLSGGGFASGPVSFMKGFDSFAGVIRSGGRTRRAACMRILDIDHPDILHTADGSPGFIICKAEEEKKARALMEAGYSADFTDPNGAYASIQFQNANHSVRLSRRFMEAVKNDGYYHTKARSSGEVVHTYNAREVLRHIAEAAHACGEPGVQFSDTINEWNTVPNVGPINASNPCSELMFIDDCSCNLASINLAKFVDTHGNFDVAAFQHVVRILIIAQDIVINNADYPTQKLAENSRKYRPLGLGFTNLHTMLMRMGIPYDSEAGNNWAAVIASLMTATAYEQSGILAIELGAFTSCEDSAICAVMQKHFDAHVALEARVYDAMLLSIAAAAGSAWHRAQRIAQETGVRNAQVTLLAPTGTISFIMDAQTTGIEPEISLIKWKQLVGGGVMKLVNPEVPRCLSVLGYSEAQAEEILDYISEHNSVDGCNTLQDHHYSVFDCAYASGTSNTCIDWTGHLRMMSAVQPFLSGAISKTISFPNSATVEDIYEAIVLAHDLGLKAVAFYRDGSKSQPVVTGNTRQDNVAVSPVRRELPSTRDASIHKFTVDGQKHYLAMGMFEDGQLGEIFLTASGGGTYDALLSNWAIAVSIALQYGVPLQDFIKQFRYKEFQPNGFTGNREIPSALSPIDYVVQYLSLHCSGADAAPDKDTEHADTNRQGPPCTNCGHMMVRKGTCYYCEMCGDSSGCS
jgi:ribonucleoside-diphosphate reductase alpha chain